MSARASTSWPVPDWGGESLKKLKTCAGLGFSFQSIASARLRNMVRFGQPGLAAMKARKRLLSAPLWSLRRIIHSTSLRAAGSEMPAATSVALLAPPRRSASMVLLTCAISAAEVCSDGPCASGICGTADLSGAGLSFLPATFFPLAFALLPAAFAVAWEPLEPRATAVSVARVTASRLAPASAATSADRYRVFKADCPQESPANRFAPSLATVVPHPLQL